MSNSKSVLPEGEVRVAHEEEGIGKTFLRGFSWSVGTIVALIVVAILGCGMCCACMYLISLSEGL